MIINYTNFAAGYHCWILIYRGITIFWSLNNAVDWIEIVNILESLNEGNGSSLDPLSKPTYS